MAEVQAKTQKKKRWIPILAPPLFRTEVLGESYVEDPKELMGRCLSVNLMALTNDVKKQNVNIRFEIDKTEKDKVWCNVTGMGIIPSSIRRLVRRGRERIDMSLAVRTSDNVNVRLKPMLLTRKLTKGSVSKAIQREVINFIRTYVPKNSYEQLVQDLVSHRFQLALKDHLKKIYPLRTCEMRWMEIEREVSDEERVKEVLKETGAGKELKAGIKEAGEMEKGSPEEEAAEKKPRKKAGKAKKDAPEEPASEEEKESTPSEENIG